MKALLGKCYYAIHSSIVPGHVCRSSFDSRPHIVSECSLININITIMPHSCKCAGVSQKLTCTRSPRATKDNYTATIQILTKTIQNTNTLHPIIYNSNKNNINCRFTHEEPQITCVQVWIDLSHVFNLKVIHLS